MIGTFGETEEMKPGLNFYNGTLRGWRHHRVFYVCAGFFLPGRVDWILSLAWAPRSSWLPGVRFSSVAAAKGSIQVRV